MNDDTGEDRMSEEDRSLTLPDDSARRGAL